MHCTHGELKMLLRPFPVFIAMLLMLAIGVWLGMLIMTSHCSTVTVSAAVDAPQASAPPAPSPVIRPGPEPVAQAVSVPPAPDQYVGVIFARQLADIAGRSEGRLEA